jgi:cold shock CspA family protein
MATYLGTIDSFKELKGYGWIKSNDPDLLLHAGADVDDVLTVFFHHSDVKTTGSGKLHLEPTTAVLFSAAEQELKGGKGCRFKALKVSHQDGSAFKRVPPQHKRTFQDEAAPASKKRHVAPVAEANIGHQVVQALLACGIITPPSQPPMAPPIPNPTSFPTQMPCNLGLPQSPLFPTQGAMGLPHSQPQYCLPPGAPGLSHSQHSCCHGYPNVQATPPSVPVPLDWLLKK